MIIVFEGIVDTGKSTLINHMQSTYNVPVFKRSATPDASQDWRQLIKHSRDICMGMYESLHASGQHVNIMHDRFHISTSLQLGEDNSTILKYSDRLYNVGAVIVYAYCSNLDVLRSRLKERNRDIDLESLHSKFESAINTIELNSKITVVKVDTSVLSVEDCCRKVEVGVI